MKKLLTLFVLLFMGLLAFAQAPQKMSYQAVVRDANNGLITNHPVSVQVSILLGSPNGDAVYVETHQVTTNANGLIPWRWVMGPCSLAVLPPYHGAWAPIS